MCGAWPPEQPQDMNCAALNAENVRLLAERDELNTPLPSANGPVGSIVR